MSRLRGRDPHLKPIANLNEYIEHKMIRSAAGWIGGKVHYEGKFYDPREFNRLFPAKLIYRAIQADGRQIKH